MQLTDLQDKHKGRLAFVLASGPSLHYEKLEGARNYVTFTANSAFLKLRACDYFVSQDVGVEDWDYFNRTLPRYNCVKLLASDSLKHHAPKFAANDVCFFDRKTAFNPQTRLIDPEALVMSKDAGQPLIDARVSAVTAVHLAYLMGCNPIVLLGTDCCYLQERAYFWQYPGEAKPQRLRGFTPPARRSIHNGKTLDDDNREAMDCWVNFGRCNPYVNVINAAVQGLLTCFPKMNYTDVIGRYGALTK